MGSDDIYSKMPDYVAGRFPAEGAEAGRMKGGVARSEEMAKAAADFRALDRVFSAARELPPQVPPGYGKEAAAGVTRRLGRLMPRAPRQKFTVINPAWWALPAAVAAAACLLVFSLVGFESPAGVQMPRAKTAAAQPEYLELMSDDFEQMAHRMFEEMENLRAEGAAMSSLPARTPLGFSVAYPFGVRPSGGVSYPGGLVVTDVHGDSPMRAVGLEPGDVIMRMGDYDFSSGGPVAIDRLRDALRVGSGPSVPVTFMRDGRPFTRTVSFEP